MTTPESDNFDLSIKVLGIELIAFSLNSKSDIKNWFVLGILSFAAVVAILSTYLPSLLALV